MKVNVYGKLMDLKIDYRFNGTDIDSIKSAIKNNGIVRHITRIKIYQYALKNIKSHDKTYICNTIQNCLFEFNIPIRHSILYNILPEFNRNNYRNIINTNFPTVGSAWDWYYARDNRIKFLEAIKRQCAIEYLSLRKY